MQRSEPKPRVRLLTRLRSLSEGGVTQVMARREMGRLLFWDRSHQSVILGVAAGCGLALLIPLHRAFGSRLGDKPYFLLYAIAIQVALLVLFARSLWAGMRQDAASGSLDELRLTGAEPQVLLLGKWAGGAVAGLVWSLMLLPGLLLAGAFTGIPPERVLAVWLCWAVTPLVGAMLGVFAALSEKGSTIAAIPFWFIFQIWIFVRILGPRLVTGVGPVAQEVLYWVHQLDPLTSIPAAVGMVREPWPLKLLFLLAAAFGVGVWLAGADRELPEYGKSRTAAAFNLAYLSLRPLREWLAQAGSVRTSAYGRDAFFQFERAHGWRLRISPPAWIFLFAFTLLPAIPAAILGEETALLGPLLSGVDVLLAGAIASLGMAACLAAEQEQGRWELLLCSPLASREIILGKWLAVALETWPLWLAGTLRAVILAAGGSFPWTLVPISALAPVVAAGGAAAVSAALCLRAPSLTSAQQRATVWAFAPTLAVLGARFLLPHLPTAEWLSPAHWTFLAGVAGSGGPAAGLLAAALYALAGAAALAWAAQSVRGALE